jgi:ElaB/YqjD/DUF883 family membrane-anchored ribosome-binding protein
MIDRIRDAAASSSMSPDQLKEQALDVAATVRERLERAATTIRDYTQNQPARALGIALGMGVFLGWLMKRR